MSEEKGYFPKSVTIFGKEIKVEVTDNLDDDVLGEFRAQEKIIYLSDFAGKETLLHEVAHAALHYSGISEMLDEKLEEAICTCMEYGLAQYIKL